MCVCVCEHLVLVQTLHPLISAFFTHKPGGYAVSGIHFYKANSIPLGVLVRKKTKWANEFQISPVKFLSTSAAVVSRNNLRVSILDNHLMSPYEWR